MVGDYDGLQGGRGKGRRGGGAALTTHRVADTGVSQAPDPSYETGRQSLGERTSAAPDHADPGNRVFGPAEAQPVADPQAAVEHPDQCYLLAVGPAFDLEDRTRGLCGDVATGLRQQGNDAGGQLVHSGPSDRRAEEHRVYLSRTSLLS